MKVGLLQSNAIFPCLHSLLTGIVFRCLQRAYGQFLQRVFQGWIHRSYAPYGITNQLTTFWQSGVDMSWSKLPTTVLFAFFVFVFCLGDTLSNFYVGVTEISPHDVPPHPHPPNYKLCLHYRSPFLQGAQEAMTCSFPVSGRYIVIQLLTAETPLSLCEVGGLYW